MTSLPKVGDQIFFVDSDGDLAHTGIVYDCDGDNVFTVEGNSGNAVKVKNYKLTDTSIAGYGRPNYDDDPGVVAAVDAEPAVEPAKGNEVTIDFSKVKEILVAISEGKEITFVIKEKE